MSKQMTERRERSAIITGGNVGLGLACAEEILRNEGWRVTLACRDPGRAREASALLQREVGGARVELGTLDLASLASVRRFAATLDGPIDALVLNAGLQLIGGRSVSADGIEATFAVNHLGHFLLANLLLEKMAPGGRIIFVSSDTHDPRNWTGMPAPRFSLPQELARGDDLPGETSGRAGRRRYTTSKLCNVYCAYEMDRRVRRVCAEHSIAINAFDPGFMPGTQLAREYGPVVHFLSSFVLPLITYVWPNANRVRTSARRLARLATDPAYDGVSGRYVSRGRTTSSSVESYDEAKARALWDASVELARLTASESPLATA